MCRTRVVHQDVDSPERIGGPIDEVSDLFSNGDVNRL
jgi:hypothetical protein